jgi:hypothetical protein
MDGQIQHEKQIAKNTQTIADFEGRFNKIEHNLEVVLEEVRKHVSAEDVTWLKFDKKLDELTTGQKVISTTIPKTLLEKWFWKSIGVVCGLPFTLYYLVMFMRELRP